MDGLWGKILLELLTWGYPHFRKPPDGLGKTYFLTQKQFHRLPVLGTGSLLGGHKYLENRAKLHRDTFLSMHNCKMNILYYIDLLYARTCYFCYLHPLQLRVLLLPLRDHASECLRDLHKDNLCVKEVFPFQEC